MTTQCTQKTFAFQGSGRREIRGRFDGGEITSDGGALLLKQVEDRTGLVRRFAACFTDYRDPTLIEHPMPDLIAQRVFGLALGYEDLNDHDQLRRDPLLAAVVGKRDPNGEDRRREADRGKALAGKSTLNRLELTPADAGPEERYKKIVIDGAAADRFFVDEFLRSFAKPPARIVLDLDATDDPVHGHQEGRFFHGYYNNYCYLPLYIFSGEFLLGARLRASNIDASAGTVEELARIVPQIRAKWPRVEIEIRADSGFARDGIMAWCEANGVDYLLGLAKNKRLTEILEPELEEAKQQYEKTQQAARVFKDFRYQTLDSWTCERRVVGKAEHLNKGSNPRFVVTSIPPERFDARTLYEAEYCARGEMENRIKEQQHYLFADRTSAATMRANQTRLYFSSVAYVLLQTLRRLGLRGTEMATAQCHTIRLKLLKIGALIRITVRKIWVSLSSGCPYAGLFAQVYANLNRGHPMRC